MIRRFLWNVVQFLYKYIAKPLLFRAQPDAVHESTINFARIFGRVGVLRWIVATVFKRRPNKKLIQTYHGVTFSNPVGLAAGFDKNGEVMPTINALGFGFGTVGSVTAKKCAGNPRPWFYRLPNTHAAVVNAGLGNDGSKAVINRLQKTKFINNFPIILSVAKTNSKQITGLASSIDDYIDTIKRAQNIEAVQIIEINISCPNSYGGEQFMTPKNLDKLLAAVEKVGLSKPIFLKMPLDLTWSRFKQLLDVAVNHNISGVTIANLLKDRTKIDLRDELPDTVHGNISGRPTWELSNDLIRQTYLEYGKKLTIIGVGGIFSAEDAYMKIRLGASLVEIFTGMLFTGPQLAAQINDQLTNLLKRDGFDNISQAIGVDSISAQK